MMKNDILGGQNIHWPLIYTYFQGCQDPSTPDELCPAVPNSVFSLPVWHLAFCMTWPCPRRTRKKNISHRQLGPLRGSSSPFSPLSRRGLNPSKPVYDPDQPDGRLNLTASAFNQLGQYTSSPSRRGYSYEELAVFFPSGGRNHRQSHCAYPRRDGQAELTWVAG